MSYILISVLCSVAVSVLLKLASRWRIDVRQAIAGNYVVAAFLCLTVLHGAPSLLLRAPTDRAWLILIALGILLPGIFLVLAQSIQRVGVVRSDAAQRLSLLLPLIAAFTLFGQTLTWPKAVGGLIGMVAIACIVARPSSRHSGNARCGGWHWPVAVFVGFGAIDILFKLMAQLTGVPFSDVLLATFVLAFVLSAAYVGWLSYRGQVSWAWRHVIAALVLGVLNFGNILFYIKAHRRLSNDPALVFSAMNIGVIILATLVGVVAFRERLTRLSRLGLLLAAVAIMILAWLM